MRGRFWGLLAACFVLSGCGGRDARYPAPVYEEPKLPKWEPPKAEEEDPFENLDDLEGEWVVDEEETSDEEETPDEEAIDQKQSTESDSEDDQSPEGPDQEKQPETGVQDTPETPK